MPPKNLQELEKSIPCLSLPVSVIFHIITRTQGIRMDAFNCAQRTVAACEPERSDAGARESLCG